MPIATAIETPLEVYLQSSYSPDCEWIDGELRERNLGQFDHANLQKLLVSRFYIQEREWNVRVLPQQRLKVSGSRYRVPDILVIRRQDKEQIITIPPLLCIEILSPDDTILDYQERVADYLTLGVGCVWVFDPKTRKAWRVESNGDWVREKDILHCGEITVNISELFRLAAE